MNHDRREAIKSILRKAVFGAPLLLIAYPVLSFITFTKKITREVVFPRKDQAAEVNSKDGVFLVRGSGGLVAFSARCTHLGCTLNHDPGHHRFVCPCHGSVFELTGKRISGPAQRSLLELPMSKGEDGSIVVTVTY